MGQGRHRWALLVAVPVAILVAGCGTSHSTRAGTTKSVRARATTTASTRATTAAPPGGTLSYDQVRTPSAHISSVPLLEAQLVRLTAELYTTEEEPAKVSAIDAFMRRLSASCTRPAFGQFACVVHARGYLRSLNACSVPATGERQLLLMRCTGPGGVPPIIRLGYVDCATIGHVVSVADPVGDTARIVTGLRTDTLKPTHAPWADLTEVRLAKTSSRLCVDFKTVAPPRTGETLTVSVGRPPRSTDPGIAAGGPTVTLGPGPVPGVQTEAGSPTTGQVGEAGDWTSLVMNARDLGSLAVLLRRSFSFWATASYETNPRDRPGLLVKDTTRTATSG